MATETQKTKQIFHTAARTLYRVPEIRPTIDYIYQNVDQTGSENPFFLINEAFHGYVYIIDDFAHLTDHDIETIRIADALSEKRGLTHNSASHHSVPVVHHRLGRDRRDTLASTMQEAVCKHGSTYNSAVNNLTERMLLGHEYAEELRPTGRKPSDSDPRTHVMIFGHTNQDWDRENSPYALFHFTLSHFWDRLFQTIYQGDQDIRDIAQAKDSFIDMMSTTIRLRQAQGITYTNITRMYSDSRPDGGLGWGRKARQQCFNEAVVINQE